MSGVGRTVDGGRGRGGKGGSAGRGTGGGAGGADMDRLAAEVRAPFVQLLTLQLQFQERRRQEDGLLELPVSPLEHPALVEMAERVQRLIGAERAEGWVAEAQEQAEEDVRRHAGGHSGYK